MRKHFLLLFLMALLPLVGWAADKPKAIINAAYTYKTYGDVDPTTPNFEFDESSPNKTDDVRDAIDDYLVLKRVNGEENQGEIVGSYLYYIDFTEDYAACPYDITILQNNSNLVIQKADLHVVVENNWKYFNTPDETPYTYYLDDPTELKYQDTEESVKIAITRPGAKDTDPVNAKFNNKGEPVHLPGNYKHYKFAGEADNYKILFVNEFLVVKTSNVNNIEVNVFNWTTVDPDYQGSNQFVYRGIAYTPGAEGDEFENLEVWDGDYELKNGKDYFVEKYEENVHVGQATVTINFEGSRYYDTDETKDGDFEIVKAPLTITANSYTVSAPGQEPEELEWTYSGFVPEQDPETPTTAKNFKEPSGVTKTAIAGSTDYELNVIEDADADDYRFIYEPGKLTYGRTNVLVRAENKNKDFGEDDPKLTYTVKHEDGSDLSPAEWAAIGGKKTPYFTISRAPGENVGNYDITFDGPTVLPEGIRITYYDGRLTIGRKTVYLKGDNCSKTYGDTNPKFDAFVYQNYTDGEYTGKWTRKQMDDEEIFNDPFYYVGVEGASWNGSEWVLASEDVTPEGEYYAVTPRLQPRHYNGITSSGNYRVVVNRDAVGEFTITPAPLTIKAENKTKMFGQADPEFTVKVTGLKLNDQVEEGVDYSLSRNAGETIGKYTIKVKILTTSEVLKNYTVTRKNGKLTIAAMNLLVKADEQAVNYGDPIDPYKAHVYYILGEDEYQETLWTPEDIEELDIFKLEADVTKVGATNPAYTLKKGNNANFAVEEFTNNWLTVNPLKTIPLDKEALKAITDIELKKVLNDHKGLTLNVTLPKRGMTVNNWYSWVLPFEVNQRAFFKGDAEEPVWGYGAMEVLDEAKTTATNVSFRLTVQSIPANTPFIVKIDNTINKDDMDDITFKGVTIADFDYINKAPTKGKADQVQFIGVYEETLMGEGSRFLTRSEGIPENGFYPGDGITLPRTHAYLQFPTENAAREAHIYVEDPNGGGTTDITRTKTEANSMNAEGWYNLNGVKVEGAPAQKGVYIKDGKKVVIK